MVDIRRTAEARKNRPFVAGVSAGVNQETSDVELQALLNALDTHKASADHDGRYFTEAEVSAFLNAKADKAQTMSLTYIHNGAMTAGQTINANVTSYGVPAGARFVLVSAQGQWAGTTGSLVVGKYGTTENDLICRPQVANLPNNNNGTVRVVSNLIRIQNNNLAGTIAVAIVGYAM